MAEEQGLGRALEVDVTASSSGAACMLCVNFSAAMGEDSHESGGIDTVTPTESGEIETVTPNHIARLAAAALKGDLPLGLQLDLQVGSKLISLN